MAYDALRTIMPIAGWPEGRAREVEISVGADPVVPTRFRIGPAGAAPRGPSDSRAGQHTPIIEPLSLDEAYLDVTENLAASAIANRPLEIGLELRSLRKLRFAGDSPLEEAGFELSVPPERKAALDRVRRPSVTRRQASLDPRRERNQENGGNGG